MGSGFSSVGIDDGALVGGAIVRELGRVADGGANERGETSEDAFVFDAFGREALRRTFSGEPIGHAGTRDFSRIHSSSWSGTNLTRRPNLMYGISLRATSARKWRGLSFRYAPACS
jgi:hypothetical protein